jgi:hypothetical protein
VQNIFVCGFWSMIDPIDGSEPGIEQTKDSAGHHPLLLCWFQVAPF